MVREIKIKDFSNDCFLSKLWLEGSSCDTVRALFLISLLDYPVHKINCEPYIDTTNFTTKIERVAAKHVINEAMEGCPPSSKIFIRYALEHLIHTIDISILKKYNNLIKKKLQNGKWKEANKNDSKKKTELVRLPYYKLYLLTPLSKQEKAEINKKYSKKYLPPWYLARLGDKKAEKDLLDRFKKAIEYGHGMKSESKAFLAKQLGIAGTPACAKALISELYSDAAEKRLNGNYKSIRVPIIKALGRMHPEETFLRMEIAFIDYAGDRSYGGEAKIKEFLSKVIEWAKKNYNVKPKGKPPKPLLVITGPEIRYK